MARKPTSLVRKHFSIVGDKNQCKQGGRVWCVCVRGGGTIMKPFRSKTDPEVFGFVARLHNCTDFSTIVRIFGVAARFQFQFHIKAAGYLRSQEFCIFWFHKI
jgi:hypothetical protein